MLVNVSTIPSTTVHEKTHKALPVFTKNPSPKFIDDQKIELRLSVE